MDSARKLLGLKSTPTDEWLVGFMLRGLEKLVAQYGEEWVRQNAPRLREELELISRM